ncbi:MAG: SCP2 sterol-binding domain-containing protein, partial [Bacillota bacterium]
NEEVILAQIKQPERSTALWTENAVICWVVADWIAKNMQFDAISLVLKDLGDENLTILLGNALSTGTELSQWDSEVPPLKPNPLWPSVETIMECLTDKFRSRDDRPVLGVYRFELFGDGGGTFQFEVSPASVSLTRHGYLQPDLLVQMSALDLRAMAVGELHPAACHVKGRIKVSGDLGLAANLQWLLQPMAHVPRVEVEL